MRKSMVGLMLVGIIALAGIQRVDAVPWIYQLGNQPNIVYGNYPINATLATEYAKTLITGYNALVESKQVHWGNFSLIQRYYYLYTGPANSWRLYVARENESSPDDQIEFLFRDFVQGDQPEVDVVTNTTAQYLRPVVASLSNPSASLLQGDTQMPGGNEMLNMVLTNSSTGAKYFPIIWITDLNSVYYDTYTNAQNAAQVIYSFDSTRGIQNQTSTTSSTQQTQGPPAPSVPQTGQSPSDTVNTLASVIFLILVAGGAFIAVKNRRVRKKITDWWNG